MELPGYTWLGLGLLVILAVVVLVGLRTRAASSPAVDNMPPYRKRDYLLTAAERSFYGVLVQAVAGTWLIFAKVRLADLVWIPAGTPARQAAMNRVQSKHIDFVLCTPDTLTPLLAIELDDTSHQREDRRARDVQVAAILVAAGLPLLRVPARTSYVPAELRVAIDQAVGTVPTGARPAAGRA